MRYRPCGTYGKGCNMRKATCALLVAMATLLGDGTPPACYTCGMPHGHQHVYGPKGSNPFAHYTHNPNPFYPIPAVNPFTGEAL